MPVVEIVTPVAPAARPGRRETLTVLTANLKNPYFSALRVDAVTLRARLEAFTALVEAQAADAVMCQEVGRGRDFRVDRWISDRLGWGGVYVRANGSAGRLGREEGLAIFSRYPLRESNAAVLAGGLWQRVALGVVAATPLGDIALYSTHHSLRPWRNRLQPGRLYRWVEETAGARPSIVGGDFNAPDGAPQIAALASTWVDTFRFANPGASGATHDFQVWGRIVTSRRLDYVFLRPGVSSLRVVNSQVIHSSPEPFSDHHAVVTHFAVGG